MPKKEWKVVRASGARLFRQNFGTKSEAREAIRDAIYGATRSRTGKPTLRIKGYLKAKIKRA